jgi:mRNA-degrading endonuclease YafQ of YafQ-DinJ toxin-antitoxin module
MKVVQSSVFKRRVKKLHPDEKVSLDKAVRTIMEDPEIGEMKTGDLAGIQIYKYKHNAQLNLLAYRFVEKELLLTLIALGSHENFYRDLKRL